MGLKYFSKIGGKERVEEIIYLFEDSFDKGEGGIPHTVIKDLAKENNICCVTLLKYLESCNYKLRANRTHGKNFYSPVNM
jgi:hypothetical protein